jgi:hypothetical protein
VAQSYSKRLSCGRPSVQSPASRPKQSKTGSQSDTIQHPTRMAMNKKIKKGASDDVEGMEPSSIAGGSAKWHSHLENFQNTVTIESSNSFPRYTLKRNETIHHMKTCTWTLITARFMIAPKWEQCKCPSLDTRTSVSLYSGALSGNEKGRKYLERLQRE